MWTQPEPPTDVVVEWSDGTTSGCMVTFAHTALDGVSTFYADPILHGAGEVVRTTVGVLPARTAIIVRGV